MKATVFTVQMRPIQRLKSAFAVIESPDAVPARARINGTVQRLLVDEGVDVRSGQLIAIVVDESLGPRAASPRAQAAAVRAQLKQVEADIARYATLNAKGFYPAQQLEAARAQAEALRAQAAALDAEGAAIAVAAGQGRVLAPVSGRVLRTPVAQGSNVVAGDALALIGSSYVLRVKLPERHAGALRPGARVLIETPDGGRLQGEVAKVYPALAEGRAEADVTAPALGARLYGQRVRIWVPAETATGLMVPASYLQTRYGVDFAKVLNARDEVEEVVVRRGEPRPTPEIADGVEVLAGLKAGDRLVR